MLTSGSIRVRRSFALVLLALATVGAVACKASAQDFTLDESQFNQWLYGRNVSDNQMESHYKLAVEAVDRACDLSDEQMAKLRLAARGDFARFERDVQRLREEVVGKTYDQNKIGEVYQQIQPLTKRYREGLLGRSSLFYKVARATFTPEQMANFDEAEAEKRKARHMASVRLFVAKLERRCPMDNAQRTRLVDLFVAETDPPLISSQFDMYVVPAQADRIPQERFRAILDDDQFKMLEISLQQGRGFRQHLIQEGVLADE
jgi:Spy/CpxP family protein refolding chaperone